MSTMDEDVTNLSQTTYSRGSRMVLISAPHSPPNEYSSCGPRHLRRWASLALPLAVTTAMSLTRPYYRQHFQNWHDFLVAFVNPETTNVELSSNWHISGAVVFGILFALNIP
jgi:hypothetical protein